MPRSPLVITFPGFPIHAIIPRSSQRHPLGIALSPPSLPCDLHSFIITPLPFLNSTSALPHANEFCTTNANCAIHQGGGGGNLFPQPCLPSPLPVHTRLIMKPIPFASVIFIFNERDSETITLISQIPQTVNSACCN